MARFVRAGKRRENRKKKGLRPLSSLVTPAQIGTVTNKIECWLLLASRVSSGYLTACSSSYGGGPRLALVCVLFNGDGAIDIDLSFP